MRALILSFFAASMIAIALGVPARAADDVATDARACGACHGDNGQPVTPDIPIVDGQQGNYLYKELHDYHSGARANPVMAAIVKPLSLPELRALANYLAARPWPARQGSVAAAAALPDGGAMCRACHGPNFEGTPAGPRLAGLNKDYLAAAMRSFADGGRTNNLDMPGFMRALTASQREAIAQYLSSL